MASTNDDRTGAPLNVVYLGHVAQLSGAEIALLRLLPYLDRVRPHVILAEHGPLVEQLHRAGISAEVVPFPERARKLRKDDVRGSGVSPAVVGSTIAYAFSLARRLRQLKPDLIHTNSLKAGVYGSVAARLAGVPMIWHVRDRIDEDYLPPAAVRLVRTMSRHLAAAVVANSHSTLSTLDPPGASMVVYSVLPEALDAAPARAHVEGRPLTFGVVGRLAPWKGQDMFLRAFARAFPGGDAGAVIIGAALFGEDEYADGLADLARTLGISERVEFRGQREDVWAELARIDVLVHSSVTAEPFGQVVLEGMAAGVPVIAADAGGPAEILRHDETGLLYRLGDPDALADAMLRTRNAALRERLAVAARSALGPYAPSAVADQLQGLYRGVVSRPRRRRVVDAIRSGRGSSR